MWPLVHVCTANLAYDLFPAQTPVRVASKAHISNAGAFVSTCAARPAPQDLIQTSAEPAEHDRDSIGSLGDLLRHEDGESSGARDEVILIDLWWADTSSFEIMCLARSC